MSFLHADLDEPGNLVERFERCDYIQSPRSFKDLPQLVVEFEVSSGVFHNVKKVFFSDKTVLAPITEEAYRLLTEYTPTGHLFDSPVPDGTEIRFGLKRDRYGAMEFHIDADDDALLQTDVKYLIEWIEDLNSYTHYHYRKQNLEGTVI